MTRKSTPVTTLLALANGIAVALLASGCASVTGSKLQAISVQTVHEGREVTGAGCTLTNDVGKWFVTTPGSVTVNKSTGDLAVDCRKDAALVGQDTVVSKANGPVWGNILAGGIIGYAVDRSTGAGFDYPTNVTVFLRRAGEALGVLAPAAAPAPVPVAEGSDPR